MFFFVALVALRMLMGDRPIASLDVNENTQQCHVVPGPTDLLTNIKEHEKNLFYVLSFYSGPLYLDIAPGPNDELEIDGFIVRSLFFYYIRLFL